MASGLFGLLDDVASLARLAATSLDDVGAAAGRATTKASGVLIDDAAVTPQYVRGLAAERELPIILRIAKGSFRNKLLFILPAALLLSEFLPWLLTPILMLGGAYLCYEAVHKIWGAVTGHDHGAHDHAVDAGGHGVGGGGTGGTHVAAEGRYAQHAQHAQHTQHADPVDHSEDAVVAGAIRTDLILSAEIMVIALDEVASEGFLSRAAILVVVAVAITLIVYGVVALIVKMDDVGLRLAEGDGLSAAFGRRLVTAMPRVLAALSIVGTAAMLWVGGHIELVGLEEFGLTAPYDLVHTLEVAVHDAAPAAGDLLAWLTNTAGSAVLGLLVGAPIVAVQQAWSSRQ